MDFGLRTGEGQHFDAPAIGTLHVFFKPMQLFTLKKLRPHETFTVSSSQS